MEGIASLPAWPGIGVADEDRHLGPRGEPWVLSGQNFEPAFWGTERPVSYRAVEPLHSGPR